MFRRILTPIDGSPCSDAALVMALQLAKELHAELRVIHVLDTAFLYVYPGSTADLGPLAREWRQAGQKVLDRAAGMARDAGVAPSAEVIDSRGGRIADVVMEEVKRWSPDLIVMGTHGLRGLAHLLIGSVAEGVIRRALVPVLLIRGE